ncbi:hypothetical protein [Streptomyces sp. NBC_01217]|uniref:hypothetical protein n=1 Tax=Streptomyces sp. NBC_01217 TaxID=2903779 RepID=UPI002E12B7E2|nr:hypothetical protein OG507_33185 [Streptomyces sp. NBC_01217]
MVPRGGTNEAGAHAPSVTAVPPGRWLFTRPDGLMTAYGQGPQGLVRWTEHTAEGWTGPEAIEVPGWAGHLSTARTREGYVHLAARRSVAADPGRSEIVLATQFQTGRALTPWHNLGAPKSTPDVDNSPAFGPLTTVNLSTGSIHVLIATRTGEIFRRSRNPEGNWGGWKSVTNGPCPGEPTAVMTDGGPLEILVQGVSEADRWVGRAQGRFELADRIATPVAAGSATAYETGPKRATFFWRYPGDNSVVAWRPQATGSEGLMTLGGAGGRGAPGVTRVILGGYDCTVLVQIALHGGMEVAAYVTENEGYGMWWAPLGGPDAESVQAVVDGFGRVVVAALDKQGVLHVTRQDTTQEGLAFGPWHQAH